MNRNSIDVQPKVWATKPLDGGNRKLVESIGGEYLVIDQVEGQIRRLLICDTIAEAWQAWRDSETEGIHTYRELNSAGGAVVPWLACPVMDGARP